MHSLAPKTPRGIQESDVWAAADALLADGQKPTIEKVRQHMGRGSPNTVAPMLDAWFSTLGARLGLNQQTQDLRNAVPSEVLEAAQALWGQALQQAQELAERALEDREKAAQEERAALLRMQQLLQQREEAMQQQKASMDAALQLAQAQREDVARRLDEMQQQLVERDQMLEKMRLETLEQRKLQQNLREQHAQEMAVATQERHRLTEQFTGNERRLLSEVDRGRQDLEKSKKMAADSEAKWQARWELAQQRVHALEEELQAKHSALLSTQQALSSSKEHMQALQQLLQQPHSATTESGVSGRTGRSLQRRALSERALRLSRK